MPEMPRVEYIEGVNIPPKRHWGDNPGGTGNNIYSIWGEGFSATGQHGTAKSFGCWRGDSFEHACDQCFDNEFDKKYYKKGEKSLILRRRLYYWGCELFPEESKARRSFG